MSSAGLRSLSCNLADKLLFSTDTVGLPKPPLCGMSGQQTTTISLRLHQFEGDYKPLAKNAYPLINAPEKAS